MMAVAEFQKKFNLALGQRTRLETQLAETQKKLARFEKDSKALEKAQAYIQTKAQETQSQLSYRVEDIVQLAIDMCFPEQYKFELKYETKRGKTEAILNLIQDGWAIDPLASNGGGLADIESFGLRIASWSLERNNNTIILDEPFRFLSPDLKPMGGEILRDVSKRLGIQFIIVTHDESIMEVADRTIRVRLKHGVSQVKIIDKD
jgi:DNA repair exonuclease SbcCD ATPase subunit